MGYNTAVLIMNDALGTIKDDPQFGKNLYNATLESTRGEQVDVPAHTYDSEGVRTRGGYVNAATVVSSQHADVPQVMVMKHNSAYVHKYRERLPDHVIEDLIGVLKDHGYRVSRAPKSWELDNKWI
jgi:hypothetical protein